MLVSPPVAPVDVATVVDVRSTLAGLAPEQRAILVLRDLDGMSETEAAQVLGVAAGTVKSRLHRARSAFVREVGTVSGAGGRWPVARFGPIARARALASSIPGAAWTEGILEAPYATTWPWVTDLEASVPRFDTQVRRLRVLTRRAEGGAERLQIAATTYGIAFPFEVRLEDGFCLMQARARLYLVLMAAEPHDDGARTRFFHLEAIPLPGTRVLRRVLQRGVDADFRNLARLAAEGF